MFKINLLSPQENVDSLVFIHGWGPGLWFYKAFTGCIFVDCFFPSTCPILLQHIVTYCQYKLMAPYKIRIWDFQMQCRLGPKLGLYKIIGSWKYMKLYVSTFDGITFLSWDSDFIVTDSIVKQLWIQHLFVSAHFFDKKNRVGLVIL